jgi:hypothetical protein
MNSSQPTEVCITVDTEFSIGGNFENPQLSPIAEPIVLGRANGSEHGLGFLLDAFSEFGMRATFFVEALQTTYFGDEPMGGIARRIIQAGQDVQLHLHPCWLYYQASPGQASDKARDDSCAGRTDAELDQFFKLGLAAFSRWRLPRPLAVRTGNFQVDANFYRAAARSGIMLSSSVALGVYRPDDERLQFEGGRQRIGPVLELPVLSYAWPLGPRRRLRSLCITACSGAELLCVLRGARDRAVSPVIVLTHPQEYVKKKDFRYATLRRNRVNQARLKFLLQFLSQHPDEFVTVPISAIRDDASRAIDIDRPPISVPFRLAAGRMVENGINDRIWWY